MSTRTPLDLLLDRIEYEPLTYTEVPSGHYATHHGILEINGIELEVMVLNDGMRIITEESLTRFFGESAPA